MSKSYRIVLPLLGLWLIGWIYMSWAAVQDDALIHLRYADNLYLHRFITYDGVHANYGASSLLYVAILAFLRGLTASPDLARATSSAAHLLLFFGLALGFSLRLPKQAFVARLAALVLLILLVAPSGVRWLDDGMETGIVVSFAAALAWLIHQQFADSESGSQTTSRGRYLLLLLLSFLAVLLRTELVLICAIGCLIIAISRGPALDRSPASRIPALGRFIRAIPASSHVLLGSILAVGVILATMHVLLPDTAVAKSHGIVQWFNPIRDTAITLGAAFSFGIGLFLFWLSTLLLVRLQSGRLTSATLLANCFCPVVLTVSVLRGQEIQGVRYFAWTFFFAVVWNILELARVPESMSAPPETARAGTLLLYIFLGVLALQLPFETIAMHRVLIRRSETMRTFASEHLDVLQARHGIASDIGYIGYFTKADICDLAGLVNGRAAAHLGSVERARACIRTGPDFLFVNLSQLIPLARMTDVSLWQVCGRYDFTNVRTSDSHYLIVRPSIADEVCRATSTAPQPVSTLLPAN